MNEKKKSREKLQAKLKDQFRDISLDVKKGRKSKTGKKLSKAQENQLILKELSKRKKKDNEEIDKVEDIKKSKSLKNEYRIINREINDPILGKIKQTIECDFDIDLSAV